MLYLGHYSHLRINLLIQNTVFHKSSFLKFLGSKWNSIILVGEFVDHGKGTFADDANFVVLVSSLPFSDMSTQGRGGEGLRNDVR